MSTSLRPSEPQAGVLLLALDRPKVHNALDLELVAALRKHISGAGPGTRAIVVCSQTSGRFCAGADLAVPDAERKAVSDELYALFEQMITAPVPIVAAIDGAAVGGGAQLALACDVRLGSERARFRFVGPAHGLSVGPWALPSTVGRHALELIFSQRFVEPEESVRIGLLDRVADAPLAEALAVARTVTGLDPDAVRRAKEHVVHGERLLERLARERTENGAVFTGEVPRR
ncbi:enoyl-CoA hydratase/methylglutaconyl-CoA hydratase [Saccharopolyspora erythraea NRRL 2338]|uniref:Enoyl-CoA hydratase-related protein n=2 Tax=Saccharopolyspora erythraea TaxID=1836 RepID=A0ABP3NEY7_SACER|nr:enoyl-CoA hydratase/isomerase family protein [Saccharopolyspora erythraea]PFG96990.1 enoyl-CoA hydratase/methylglutaconyl-CoA hydratase [Saccharopolyspora erythraea NRRL 2338]